MQLLRDIAIGTAGRVVACASILRESSGDPFLRDALIRCGHVIANCAEIVTAIGNQVPELKIPIAESEWSSIESKRAGENPAAARLEPYEALLMHIAVIMDRITTIMELAGLPEPLVVETRENLVALLEIVMSNRHQLRPSTSRTSN